MGKFKILQILFPDMDDSQHSGHDVMPP